jgi:lipoprotein
LTLLVKKGKITVFSGISFVGGCFLRAQKADFQARGTMEKALITSNVPSEFFRRSFKKNGQYAHY